MVLPAILFAVFAYIIYYAVIPVIPKKTPTRSAPINTDKDKPEGYSYIWRSKEVRELQQRPTGTDIDTLCDIFDYAKEKHGDKDALGKRTTVDHKMKKVKEKDSEGKEVEKDHMIQSQTAYKFKSYNEIHAEATAFGSGVVGLSKGKHNGKERTALKFGAKVSIYASTRPEWLIAAHGAFQHGLVVATCYPSLGPDALEYVLNQCEVTTIITEAKLINDTLHKKLDKLKNVETVIYFDSYDPKKTAFDDKLKELKDKYKQINFVKYDDVVSQGKKDKVEGKRPSYDDTAVIMYTSGSTGTPKGVVITHGNIVSELGGIYELLPTALTPEDTYIAFLPLAHILELAAENTLLFVGARLGYSSAQTLRDEQVNDENGKPAGDLSKLKPTLLALVPAVAEKLQTGILDVLAKQGKIATALFHTAYYFKRRNFLRGQSSPIWDAIIFNKIADKFGGKLRNILSGGAPLSSSTQMFLTVAFKAPVLQGYGLTETIGAGSICRPDDVQYGSVGGIVPSVEIKLKDCKDMGYMSTDKPNPRGEILIRGPVIAKGYYKMEDKTKEDFTESDDGSPHRWFSTGDIGEFDKVGQLWIIDRKKDLVKLKSGEYMALGKVESSLAESDYVENICLYANGSLTKPVALVVVKGKKAGSDLDSESTKKKVLDDLQSVAQKAGVNKTEIPSKIKLLKDPWTPDTGLVTEAMKLKRQEVEKKFAKEIEQLCKDAGGKFKDQ